MATGEIKEKCEKDVNNFCTTFRDLKSSATAAGDYVKK
jgi:hypothetical protein